MFSFWWLRQLQRRWFPRRRIRRAPARRAPTCRMRPRLEVLEDRTLLSGLPFDTPTDASQLIQDITFADNNPGSYTLALASNTSYVLDNTTGALPGIAAGVNLTIVGQGAASDSIQRSSSASAFRLFNVAAGGSLTLENLTLQGGLAQGAGTAAEGGAIYDSGALNLSGVSFKSNQAHGNNGGAALGGGLYVAAAAGAVTLSNDTFTNNAAVGGNGSNGKHGGLFSIMTAVSHPGFPGGTGGAGLGGALYVAGGSLTLTHTSISSNKATGGNGGIAGSGFLGGLGGTGGAASGGGLYVAGGNVTLNDVPLRSNEATGGAGGRGGQGQAESLGGSAGKGGTGGAASGGGLYVAGGNITLTTETLSDNKATGGAGGAGGPNVNTGQAGDGGNGGAGIGGAVAVTGAASLTVTLTNAILSGNTASGGIAHGGTGSLAGFHHGLSGSGGNGMGGGMFVGSGNVTLSNDTLNNNKAVGSDGGSGSKKPSRGTLAGVLLFPGSGGAASGGGLDVKGGNVTLTNDTLSSNQAMGGRGSAGTSPFGIGGTASGGGLYVGGGVVALSNDVLSNNQAAAGSGGVLYKSGASHGTFKSNVVKGGNGSNAYGGGLYVAGGTVTLSNTILSNNKAVAAAGFASNFWTPSRAFIIASGGTGGSAYGGGLYATGGTVTLTGDTLNGNQALGANGLKFTGPTNPGAAAVEGGSAGAGLGGAVYVAGAATTVTLTNDTFSGNEAVAGNAGDATDGWLIGGSGAGGAGGAASGGGLDVAAGNVTLLNDTLSGNQAVAGAGGHGGSGSSGGFPSHVGGGNGGNGGNGAGGGLYVGSGSIVNLTNTLIALNTETAGTGGAAGSFTSGNGAPSPGSVGSAIGPDVAGNVNSSDHDLIGDGGNSGDSNLSNDDSGGDLVGYTAAQLNLGPLADNDGLILAGASGNQQVVQTIALLTGSPAINAGDSSAPGVPDTDQRGDPRIVGSAIDLGAYENQTAMSATQTAIHAPTVAYGSNGSVTVTVSSSGGTPTGNVTLTVDNGSPITQALGSNGSSTFTLSGLAAGDHSLSASYARQGDFDASSATDTLTINKAPLTVTAGNATIIQGEALPTFTVSYSGFVPGEDPSVLGGTLTLSTTATSGSAPGTYAITPSGLTSGNYAITFVPGTLTILSYSQATTSLQTQVATTGLQHGAQSSLDAQLQSAIADFNAGNTTAGVRQLQAFIHHVSAQSGKHIDAALADAWIADAEQIINAV